MPKIPKKIQPADESDVCVACGGTGVASKGGRCVPCKGSGTKHWPIVLKWLAGDYRKPVKGKSERAKNPR